MGWSGGGQGAAAGSTENYLGIDLSKVACYGHPMATAARLDSSFQALANATRRAIVERLLLGPATVSELAAPFRMALPSFLQHLDVLESCGLVRSRKKGRVRTVRLVPARLDLAAHWLDKQRAIWNSRLDRFDSYVTTLEKNP